MAFPHVATLTVLALHWLAPGVLLAQTDWTRIGAPEALILALSLTLIGVSLAPTPGRAG